jgi:hypothetical protein
MNWHNSRAGFWLNALTIGAADVPFILFVLVPGYMPFGPGFLGPALWIAGMIFTGRGQKRPHPESRACLCVILFGGFLQGDCHYLRDEILIESSPHLRFRDTNRVSG